MFDRMRSTLRQEQERQIVPLQAHDLQSAAPELWENAYADLADDILASPELAWRVEGTSEYIIGSYWRRRREIGSVEELRARQQRGRLIRHLRQQLTSLDASLLVVGPTEQERSLGVYLDEGFHVVDEIVRYQRGGLDLRIQEPTCTIRPLLPQDLEQTVVVDHAAFPWLWWNSREEFDWYLRLPGVSAYVATEDDRVVAYAGFTLSGRQGHLDRLAVEPRSQGRGYGRDLVLYTMRYMAVRRIERIALTTQVNNHRSASLYGSLGFIRTAMRYPIYGVWLGDTEEQPLSL